MSGLIKAAGAVLWRRAGSGAVEVAVVHRPRYDDWSLPKGKLGRGETTCAAAVREVAEETGFRAVLGAHLDRVAYTVPQGDKVVDYFAARAATGSFEVNDEVDALRWLDPAEAAPLLTHDGDRAVLARFVDVGVDTTTVLLVRHAHAGKKEEWPGPDDERPLSKTGERQTRALTRLLPLFHPDRVHTVPKLRCAATVAPLAGLLGLGTTVEPTLSEPSHKRKPSAAPARLRVIAARGGTAVVCSQGGVIPDVLAALAEGTGVPTDSRCRKGSVWILSFAKGPRPRLVSAHYLVP